MGTRSNVVIKDGRTTLLRIYRQFDGYPEGIGDDIKRILNNGDVELVNGYSLGAKIPKTFNGIADLGAYLLGKLKGNDIGNVYLDVPKPLKVDDWGGMSIEYEYTLSDKKGKLHLVIKGYRKTLYEGLLKDADMKKIASSE